jgi:two-component system chemotaxis response regulator CheB
MGDDGAQGLLELRRTGGYTLAEDRTTAVVHGMPGVAERIGAACEMLPLPAIAARIREIRASLAGQPS